VGFLTNLFDTSGFPARWQCGSAWAEEPWVGWLHILSDLGVWSAYLAIPLVLVYFILRRKDLPFRKIFLLFGAFILACGTTHLMEAIIFWWPAYRLAGAIKLLTAVVSWATVVALVPVVPRVLAMRSPEELEREIEARKKAEQDLQTANADLERRIEDRTRQQKEVLQLVNKIGKIGHWEWDSLTDENKWSPEIEALYGLPPGGFSGGYDGWAKLLHPDDVPKANADVKRAFETGEYFTEFRVIWPDGSIHWLETRANVFKDGHDKPVRIMGVNMDVTDRKRVEEELRQIQRELQQRIEQLADADHRKDQFLATLAHELRNPLAPIYNGLQLMRIAGSDLNAIEQSRSMMERQTAQLVRLVDDLMDMSRINRGRIELRREKVELATVIHSAVESSRPLIEQMGHKISVSLPNDLLIVDADLTRLAQVFVNLLNNAAKYTERGGQLWLTAERQGSEAMVSVRDNGIGIPADQLSHIFEMFSQVDQTLERSQGGLGIGLTLVKRLVEMHNGNIEARSDGLGKGSEFIVRIPLVLDTAPPTAKREGKQPEIETSLRILIVDDNRDGADTLAMMLKAAGNDIRTAYDGEQALAACEAFRPEVILLDLGLPKLNGYEVCRRIRQQPWGKQMVIIARTGWGQDEDRQRTREAGFDHHLVKPVDRSALLKLLAELRPAARAG
jgi:PAS domain S-box-containing protein